MRASSGAAPAPGGLRARSPPAPFPSPSRLPVYEELVGDGEHGLLFEPGDADTLAAQLARLVGDPALRARCTRPPTPLRDGLELGARRRRAGGRLRRPRRQRHDGRGDRALRAKVAKRRRIDVDLHMHTDHSPDCATPVEVLLATAKTRGLGAIAVTDHNGSPARSRRGEGERIKVIVGEEIKTADQGEVIGLFLRS